MSSNTSKIEPAVMSVYDFAAWAGISRPWAWKQVYNGNVHSIKKGRRRLIPMEAARAWLNDAQVAA